MSSQIVPTMPPTAPPRRAGHRSLAVPIVLIVIGVLALLGNFHYVTWVSLGALFARFWPALIILWGVIKLAEHYRARREGYVASGIGFGGAVLLIFLIICGISATEATRVNWAQVGDELGISDSGIFNVPLGNSYDFDDEVEQSFPPNANLRVLSDHGDVTVLPWDEKKIKISMHKHVRASSENDAKQVNSATKPTITAAANVITVNANTAGAWRDHSVATDLEIYLPRKAAVEVATAAGSLTVRDRASDLKLSNSRGDITVSGVAGNVAITMRKGDVHAEQISGNVEFNGTVNDISLQKISGTVHLSGDFFGNIALSQIGQGVQFSSSRTQMEFAKLDGDLTMESGDLHVQGASGTMRVITRAKDIHLQDVSGDVQVQNDNGDVKVDVAKTSVGNISVNNRNGDILMVLPANGSFRVEGHAHQGDISTDFPQLKVTTLNSDSMISGVTGDGGGPAVRLNTEHADIAVRKSG